MARLFVLSSNIGKILDFSLERLYIIEVLMHACATIYVLRLEMLTLFSMNYQRVVYMLHVGALNPRFVLYSNVFITEVGLKSSSGSHLGVIKTIWLSKLLKFQTYFSKSCYKNFTILLVSLYVIWVDHWRLESMQLGQNTKFCSRHTFSL